MTSPPSLRVISGPSPVNRRLIQTGAGLLLASAALIFWSGLAGSQDFLPHAFCYLQRPGLIGLHLVSDLLIGCAYVAISFTLAYMVRRSQHDMPFSWMFLSFGAFIVACGCTHFMEVVTLWRPIYWLSGNVKAITAIASVTTAVMLPPVVPKVLAMIASARLSEERQRELELAHTRLKELDVLKTQFFANVSHELRTPLALILGPAERLLDDGVTGEQRRQVDTIQRNARLLLKHVNDLLDVARLQAGKMALRCSEFDFSRLARRATGYFETVAVNRNIRFELQTSETAAVQADQERIEHVLLNLLANAFKFTPDGGTIRVKLERRGETFRLAVADSGIGVRPEHRQIIFEPFRQADGGFTRRFGGTGLGLAIVKDFVELHGGTVEVDDAPEGGARFTVEIPARRAASERPDIAPEETQLPADVVATHIQPESAPPAPGPLAHANLEVERGLAAAPLVLVVEDNAEMNGFIAETLAPDFRVVRAFDGKQGLEQAVALRPHLIVTDVMMPEMSGDQMIREMRSHPELEGIAVLVLSARADDRLRSEMLRSGAQDYLVKPFSSEELLARAHNLATVASVRTMLQDELATRNRNIDALTRDLLERSRMIRRSEMAFRSLAEALPEIIWTANALHETEYVNRRWTEYTGHAEEPSAIRWNAAVFAEDRAPMMAAWTAALSGRDSMLVECRLLRHDGVYRWHRVRILPLEEEAGRITRWLCTSIDIEDQKQAAEASRRYATELEVAVSERTIRLKETASELAAILEVVGALVIVIDQEGRIVRFNRACERMTGYSFPEVRNRAVWDLLSLADEDERFRKFIEEMQSGQRHDEYEGRWLTREGVQRVIEWSGTALADGAPGHMIATGIDITDRRRLEQTVHEIGDQERRRIGRYLHDDLGQHLTGIAFMCKAQEQTLKENGLPCAPDAGRIVGLVNEAIHKIRRLSHGFLPVISNPDGLMAALQSWAGTVEELYGIACRFRCAEPVLIHNDSVATHLYRIAQEAVANAIKHGGAGTIEISLSADHERGALDIRDDGEGVEETRSNTEGMGLHIMRDRARLIMGWLEVKQLTPRGTVVRCMFPMTHATKPRY